MNTNTNQRIVLAFTPIQWEAIRVALDYTNAHYCKPNNHEVMVKVFTVLSKVIKDGVERSMEDPWEVE